MLDRDQADPRHVALSIPCDISDPVAVDAAVAQVVGTLGRLDVVVNNAGMVSVGTGTESGSLLDMSLAQRADHERHRTLHFGLGAAKSVERVEIRWPSGATQVVTAPKIDALTLITEPVR